MTVLLGGWGIRQWRWRSVAAVCAAAVVASCGVARPGGGPARSPAAVTGAVARAAGPVLGFRLNGVAAVSAGDAWAVGLSHLGAALHVIRWDGQAWRQVPAPSDGDSYGLAALSAADAWAVGYGPGGTQALTEHWNGTGRAGPCPPS